MFVAKLRWLTISCTLLCALILSLAGTAPLYAHGGGVPRLTGELAGPYRIFVWSQPEPLRVGEIHLSIGVVKAVVDGDQAGNALDEPVTNAAVTVSLQPVTANVLPIRTRAILQEQLGSYYYEADATLPTAGDWHFTIDVSGDLGSGSAAFVGTVATAREINWVLLMTAGVLLLFLLGLIGVWNRMQAKEIVS
ncbi:MAG: hypothetical protein R3E79_19055 [Caldilineaceae bacterium]